jgi:hypothetical protein
LVFLICFAERRTPNVVLEVFRRTPDTQTPNGTRRQDEKN